MEMYLRSTGTHPTEVKDMGITLLHLLPSLQCEYKKWKDVTKSHLRRRDHALVKRLNTYVTELSSNIPKLEDMTKLESSLSEVKSDEPYD